MKEVELFVLEQLKTVFSIELTKALYNESVFSRKINLEARNFIDLIYSIEKEYQIIFREESFLKESFTTFNGLVNEIEKMQLEKNIILN